MKQTTTLKERLADNTHAINRDELKERINDEASQMIKYHPSNRPKDIDNPKLKRLYSSSSRINWVVCGSAEDVTPVLEETFGALDIKLIKVDCRDFRNRDSLFSFIAQETSSSKNGTYKWGYRCDMSKPWDYMLLFEHIEAFDPIDTTGAINTDLRFCLRAVGSILKDDDNPPVVAIASHENHISDELFSELFTRSYAKAFIYSED